MKGNAFRHRLAYWLRSLAWRIEPRYALDDISNYITNIEPLDTPVLTDPNFKLCEWSDDDPHPRLDTSKIVWGDDAPPPVLDQGLRRHSGDGDSPDVPRGEDRA